MNYEHVLKREDQHLARLLGHYSGQHLLLLSNHVLLSLTASPMSHKIQVSNTLLSVDAKLSGCSFLKSAYTSLPFASESINLVLLPHTLEYDKNARLVLSEAWRVLAPNGHLMLLGTNPLSLWGLYYLFASSEDADRGGCFHAIQTICRWIHHLGGEICRTESFLFRPPLTSSLGKWLFDRLFWLEKISPWLFPYLGGVYLIIAQKHVKRPSDVGLAWHFSPALSHKVLAPNVREAHHI